MNPYTEKAARMFGCHENDVTVRQRDAAKRICRTFKLGLGMTEEEFNRWEQEEIRKAIAKVDADQRVPMGKK